MATLVTGGKGFIGSQIIRKLVERGEEVVCLEPKTTPGRLGELASKITLVEGRIESMEDVLGVVERYPIDRIAHMVFYAARDRIEDLWREVDIMVSGTGYVFEAARRRGVKRVLFPSSVAYHGPQRFFGERPINEDDPSLAITPYGVGKRLAEVMAQEYNERAGMEIVSVRIPPVYGPGGRLGSRSSSLIATAGALEQPVHMPQDPDERLCVAHVQDVAEVFVRLLLADEVRRPVYHVGGHAVSYRELEAIAREVLPNLKVIYQRVVPLEDVGLPYLIDNSRLVEDLGFRHRDLRQAYHELINLSRQESGLAPV